MNTIHADRYPDSLTAKDALPIYFSKYHFVNGGYDDKWFKIKVGPLFIPLPNTKGRIDAVKIHDIHHLLTEYPATLRGEAEIAGWEIASGCGKYYAAWVLNDGSFFYGLFFFPRALFKAFVRGRACRTNYYYNTVYDAGLLQKTLGEMRKEVGLQQEVKAGISDILHFLLYSIACLVSAVIFWGLILLPLFLYVF